MQLPGDFVFSQSNLQDYVDCRKRFYLRHIRHIAWPAVEAEPFLEHERDMLAGSAFHRMVQQHLSGVPASRLEPFSHSRSTLEAGAPRGHLENWWQNYRQSPPYGCHPATAYLLQASFPDQGSFPELNLACPFGGYRLVAKCDLVLFVEGGRAIIFDWKTSQHRPNRQWLAARLQTRIYPYLLVKAGAAVRREEVLHPDCIEMIYWFSAFPDRPEIFSYDLGTFEKDELFLLGLIREIEGLEEQEFSIVQDPRRCRYCTYRSLCDRGNEAGRLDDNPDLGNLEEEKESLLFDFEQIAEIEF